MTVIVDVHRLDGSPALAPVINAGDEGASGSRGLSNPNLWLFDRHRRQDFRPEFCQSSNGNLDAIVWCEREALFDIERVLKRIRLGPVNTEPCKHLFPRIQMSNIEI